MISAWDVYWVMQLDSMNTAFFFIAAVALIAAAVSMIFRAVHFAEIGDEPVIDTGENSHLRHYFREVHNDWADRRSSRALSDKAAKWAQRFAGVFVFAFVAVVAIPSTKVAAAMIVLPALTSEEVTKPLAKEAGDLYRLAKRALEEAVDAEPEAKD